MCGGETACSEPEQYQPGLHHQQPHGGQGQSWGGKRCQQLPQDMVPVFLAGKPSKEMGNARGASLQPYFVVWKAIWMENEESLRKENGTEIKGAESGLEKLLKMSISPHQKAVFYFPCKETKWTAGTIVVARTPGDVRAAARARWQG